MAALAALAARPAYAAAGGNGALDAEAQYAAVVAAMKSPSATGVLITEVAPESAAASAGLRGGDIIVGYRGLPIATLAQLRTAVANAIAEGLTSEGTIMDPTSASRLVVIDVRRPGTPEPVELQIGREPLGIRALEVVAQVAVEGNPPPSLRGHVKMAWENVIANESGDDAAIGGTAWFWTQEADGPKVNWQRRTLRVVGDHEIECRLEVFPDDGAVDPNTPPGQPAEDVSFTLRGGDYDHAPAFVLLSVRRHDAGDVERIAERLGPNLKVAGLTNPAPLDSAVSAATPYIAAAMPHEAGAVLALHLTSVRDFIARPGYVLITRGMQPFLSAQTQPATQPAQHAQSATVSGWRVDLQHCGVVVESYWFNERRDLLRQQTGGGTPLITRRVPDESGARRAPEKRLPPPPPPPPTPDP
jgi:hypothetical protein